MSQRRVVGTLRLPTLRPSCSLLGFSYCTMAVRKQQPLERGRPPLGWTIDTITYSTIVVVSSSVQQRGCRLALATHQTNRIKWCANYFVYIWFLVPRMVRIERLPTKTSLLCRFAMCRFLCHLTPVPTRQKQRYLKFKNSIVGYFRIGFAEILSYHILSGS